MGVSKSIRDMKEKLDMDIRLLAMEMDVSANGIRYISRHSLDDAFLIENFDSLINDIENGEGIEISSISDNAVMYEYLDQTVTVYTTISQKSLFFDISLSRKMERRMRGYISTT